MARISEHVHTAKRILRHYAQRTMHAILRTRKVQKHPDTYLAFEKLGTRQLPYHPTFNIRGPYLNDNHRFFSTWSFAREGEPQMVIPLPSRFKKGHEIRGWLMPQDALKLYEFAFLVSGDILELGAYHGMSTCIMSRAHYDSPYRKWIHSVDIDPENIEITQQNLVVEQLDKRVSVLCDDALSAVRKMAAEGKKFEFIFVDHSHTYEDVYQICKELEPVLLRGGFCLFHDFTNPENTNPDRPDIGVYKGVMDGLDLSRFEFFGNYGSCGLFRYTG